MCMFWATYPTGSTHQLRCFHRAQWTNVTFVCFHQAQAEQRDRAACVATKPFFTKKDFLTNSLTNFMLSGATNEA